MSGENRSTVSSWPAFVAGAVLVIAVVVAYVNSVRGVWVYDDIGSIVQNAAIRHLATALVPVGDGLPIAGRPLVGLSLALNYAMSGTAPWSYHVANIAIHAAAALLLFGVVRGTLVRGGGHGGGAAAARAQPAWARPVGGDRPTLVALVVALIWALHPLDTEAVTYVVQRAESMMAALYLLTLYGFVRGTGAAAPRRPWLGVSVLACAAGMATKEVMVSAPVMVLLYDRTFVSGSLRAAWRARRGYYLGLAATWLILLGLLTISGSRGGTAGFATTTGAFGYAAVQLRAHLLYLKLVLWPHPLVFDYGTDVLPLARAQLAGGVIVAGLVAASMWQAWRNTPAGFLAIAYWAVLAPSSSVVPVVTEMVAEHRMYLPLALLAVLAVVSAYRLVGRRALPSLALGVVALAALTVARSRAYYSERALWSDTVAKSPINARARFNLAKCLVDAGDVGGAVEQLRAAVDIRPKFPSAHASLADAFVRLGDATPARREAEIALQSSPNLPEAHAALGGALFLARDYAAALREYAIAVRLSPENPEILGNYATALTRVNRLPEAVTQYEAALRLRPASASLHFDLGNTFARLGRFRSAASEYEAALRIDPRFAAAADHLARVRQLEAARTAAPPAP